MNGTAPRGFLRSLVEPLEGVDARAATIVVVATVCYLVSKFEASGDFYNAHLKSWLTYGRFFDLGSDLYWLSSSNLVFGLVPLLALALLREPFSEYGLGLGDRRFGLKATAALLAVMLPLVAVAARSSAFAGAYPLNGNAHKDWGHFVVFETLYLSYFAGWELFHRGFLLFGLRRRIGNLAIFVQALPFTLMHFAKPEPEAWGSLVAGVALGLLAVRARSFWYGVAVHAGVAFTMDVLQSWKYLHHG
jgi:membrane protease YdiL (CAAX protease family)